MWTNRGFAAVARAVTGVSMDVTAEQIVSRWRALKAA